MDHTRKPGARTSNAAACFGVASTVLSVGWCCACDPSPKGPVASAAPSSSVQIAPPRPPSASASASASMRATEYCRALTVTGEVLVDGAAPLKRGDEVDGKRWLTLKPGASVVIRHAHSSREYALSGPGRARPCHRGEEEVLLAAGEFKATSGGGARPGAFVTLATPWGTLRYGNADASIRATSQAAEVRVTTGTVWVDAAQGAKLLGDAKLTGPKARATLRATGEYSRDAIVSACEADSKTAEEKAESLLKGRGQPGFGAEAAEHMRLRAAARRSCQVAQATLGLAVEPAEAAALEKRLDGANSRWQRVPLSVTRKHQQK
ncbi:MAG TPA: hypothetical protein VI197_09505 [Polyangiaceae bacterium]